MHQMILLLAILLCSPVVCPQPEKPRVISSHARVVLDQLKLIVPKLVLPEGSGGRFYTTVDEDDRHTPVPFSKDLRNLDLFFETVLANGDGGCNDAGWDALRRVCNTFEYKPIVIYLGKGHGYQIRCYTDGLLICIQQENPFR